jgi:hypothetical protein
METIFHPSPFVKHFCGLNLILVFRNLNPFLFEMIIHWTFLTAAKKNHQSKNKASKKC